MNTNIDYDEYLDDDIIFYSVLYSSITVLFAMAVLSKFLTNEFRFGFRSVLSLAVLFLGEPLCQFFIKGPGGVVAFAMCCLVIYTVLPASHLPVGNKAVLITGSLFLFSSSSIKVQNDYCHYYGTDTYLVIKNIYLRIRVCMINIYYILLLLFIQLIVDEEVILQYFMIMRCSKKIMVICREVKYFFLH
jgi:hypothetical protein